MYFSHRTGAEGRTDEGEEAGAPVKLVHQKMVWDGKRWTENRKGKANWRKSAPQREKLG